MKIASQIDRSRFTKSQCSLKQVLTVVIFTIFGGLTIISPVILARQTNIINKQAGQSTKRDQASRIVQITHLNSNLTYDGLGWWNKDDNAYAGTTIALLQDGRVYTWGSNIHGAIGNDTTCTMINNVYPKQPPCYYSQPQEITKYFGGDKVTKLVTDDDQVMAITESGKVYHWGGRGTSIVHPAQYQKLSPYHIIGYSAPGDLADIEYAYSNDTIFRLIGSGSLNENEPVVYDTVKPRLDGATIKHVDHVLHNYGTLDDSRGGFYVLTSSDKLLHVQKDGTTVEITNPTIANRGGIRQIYRHYAVDNQGGLWYYGHDKTSTNHETITDLSTKLSQPIPILRDIIGSSIRSFNPLVRSIDGRIHVLMSFNTNSDQYEELYDITDTLSEKKIKLFSGNIEIPLSVHPPDDNIYYDYSFITTDEDEPDIVCSVVKKAYNYYHPDPAIFNPLRGNKQKPANKNTNPAVCVKIPPNSPDPVTPPSSTQPPAPTPTPTSTPHRAKPKVPYAPSTGLRDDKVVQLVHSPATFDYYGEQKSGYLDTWRDQDYAGTTVVLTESGKLYAWGNNIAGGVGNDTGYGATSNKKPPVYYSDPQDITRFFNGDKIVKLVNHYHTFAAITSSGKVYY